VKREKQLTKRERKALKAPATTGHDHQHEHIHCVACGRHLDQSEFAATPPKAVVLACAHGTKFPSCWECRATTRGILDTHDRTGQNVEAAERWH
jgi:hypothetical protein